MTSSTAPSSQAHVEHWEHHAPDKLRDGPSSRCLSVWLLTLTLLSLASLLVASAGLRIGWFIGQGRLDEEKKGDAQPSTFMPVNTMAGLGNDAHQSLEAIRLPVSLDGRRTRTYRVEAIESSPHSNETILFLTLGHKATLSSTALTLEDESGSELMKLRFFAGKEVGPGAMPDGEDVFKGDGLGIFEELETKEPNRDLMGRARYDEGSSSDSDEPTVIVQFNYPYSYPLTVAAERNVGFGWGGYYGGQGPWGYGGYRRRALNEENEINVVCTELKCYLLSDDDIDDTH
eukprot:GHVN01101185.1.p1 GENE.GHVN01101185.1~~GHVN01101185.1.p1  ORF type:complete len:288 (+),score=36.08 GHVN01101185.1:84-947(+)